MRSEILNLSKGMANLLEKHGITTPTPIQLEIIPAIFKGRDVLAQSETGSGKTLSFAIPIIEQMNRSDGLRTLVIAPTRELTVQISEEFIKFSLGKHLGITPVYGGVSMGAQRKKFETTNVVVATPGRLLDFLTRRELKLDKIKYLILDEADRMLDMGFIKDIEKILAYIPKERQTMLFSATISSDIERLSQRYLHNAVNVKMAPVVKADLLHQTYYQTTPEQRVAVLIHLLKKERDLALVFCNRKHITKKLSKQLMREGIDAKCLHGDMSQSQREKVTRDFKAKKFSILIATDVAARGLHIDDITHVYNYEIPRDVDSYTHRIGRTARAGKKGDAISLIANEEEKKFFQQILFYYRGSIALKTIDSQLLPRLAPPPKVEQGQHRRPQSQGQGQGQRRQDKRHHGGGGGGQSGPKKGIKGRFHGNRDRH